MASGISTETELKLIGVARASLEELLEDYRDHLRSRKLQLWEKDDPRILQIRQLAKLKNKSCETYKSYLPANDPELFCNVMISLIHQTNFLLDRQLKSLEAKFVQKGGLRERMTRSRTAYRDKQADFSGELCGGCWIGPHSDSVKIPSFFQNSICNLAEMVYIDGMHS